MSGFHTLTHHTGDRNFRAVVEAAQQALNDVLKKKPWLLDGAFLVAHLADAKELRCSNLGWGDEEARRLAAALRHAHTHGALKALETLELIDNEIGDEGMRHLADALVRGAAPALKYLHLFNNPASDAAQQAVKDALENRSK